MSDRASRLRRLARGCLILGVVLLLAGVALYPARNGPEVGTRMAGSGLAALAGGGRQNITLNATDAPAFDPAKVVGVAGTTLGFEVRNSGTYDHTFTISAEANFTIPPSLTPQELTAFFAANGSLLNLSVPAGQTVFANLSLPASEAGATFEFVSLVPYQFQAGMSGVLQVAYSTSAAGYQLSTQTTDSLHFVPDSLVIENASQFPITVSVEVTNAGTTPHTFTIEGQSNNTLLASNFTSYFSSHAPLARAQVPTTSGVPVWANFTVTGKGAFEFICEIPGHFAGGMFGWLYVGYSPSPPPAPPSSAIVDSSFLVVAGSLLGLALLLTVVATFVGRFPPRSPGEPRHP